MRLHRNRSPSEVEPVTPSDEPPLAAAGVYQSTFDEAVESGTARYRTDDEDEFDRLYEIYRKLPERDDGNRWVDHEGHLLTVILSGYD